MISNYRFLHSIIIKPDEENYKYYDVLYFSLLRFPLEQNEMYIFLYTITISKSCCLYFHGWLALNGRFFLNVLALCSCTRSFLCLFFIFLSYLKNIRKLKKNQIFIMIFSIFNTYVINIVFVNKTNKKMIRNE